MSYQVLARKWRPKKFQDVIGQEAITRSLQNAIKRSRLGHAYLFSGTRGIGKTSVARLFAQAIRCESLTPDDNPCGICFACQDMQQSNSMNVIEIDGASNNTVDEVRELINNVQYLPTNGSHKIYIIDEVHMLSKSAFNALLKTLEEPPSHVIFLLATTEPHKLLGTVLSRCQRFDFVNASVDDLTDHLMKISKSEGIVFDNEDQIRDIARLGNGSVRDTLSLMDQVLSYTSDNHVSEEVLAKSLGVARREPLDQIIIALFDGDAQLTVENCKQAFRENISLKALLTSILENIFTVIENVDNESWLNKKSNIQDAINGVSTAEIFWVYESLAKESSWIFDSVAPVQSFLVSIKKLALRNSLLGLDKSSSDIQKKKTKPVVEQKIVEPMIVIKDEVQQVEEPKVEAKKALPIIEKPKLIVKELDAFLKIIEVEAPTLSASLEHAYIDPARFIDKQMKITYPAEGNVFYDVINQEQTRERLTALLRDHVEAKMDLVIEIETSTQKNVTTRAQERKEQDALSEEQRKKELLEDPMLKLAQEMFNTKVDKIQMGKKGE